MNLDAFLQILAISVWVLVSIVAIIRLVRRWRRAGFIHALEGVFSWVNLVLILIGAAFTLLAMTVVFIPPTHGGVVISFAEENGYREQPLLSGLHTIIPVSEFVVMYPIVQQTYTMNQTSGGQGLNGNDAITARTSDNQIVNIDSSVIFSLDFTRLVQIHINWQDRYVEDFIRPTVRGEVLTTISNYTVTDINSDIRQDIEAQLNLTLEEALAEHGIILDRFLIRNIGLSPEYAAAIEQKQAREQAVLQSEYDAEVIRNLAAGQADQTVELSRAEAQRQVIEAQAEAEALQLISQVIIDNPELLTLMYINKLAPGMRGFAGQPEDIVLLPTIDVPATLTITPTPPPTYTLTPTPTATYTPTATATPTATNTPTLTVTNTVTQTLTATPSATLGISLTPSPVPTLRNLLCPLLDPNIEVGDAGRINPDVGLVSNIRQGPGLNEPPVGTIPEGEAFWVQDLSCEDDYLWLLIEYNGLIGWIAGADDVLYYTEPPDGDVVPNTAPTATASPTPLAIIGTCGTLPPRLKVGTVGRVTLGGKAHNIRVGPGQSAGLLDSAPPGTPFEVIGGPACVGDILWWNVQTLDAAAISGWMAEGFGSPPDGYLVEPCPSCTEVID